MLVNPSLIGIGHGRVATSSWRWRGELHATVVVKVAFHLHPRAVMQPADIPALRPDEMQPYLAQADVLFMGDARLPTAVRGVTVRLGVFREHVLVDKTLALSSDTPFDHLPVPQFGAERKVTFGSKLADDLDWASLQSAPVDQRCPYLRGDEWVVLEGLSRQSVVMRSRLPNVHAKARVRFADEGLHEVLLCCDTLVIHGDDDVCTMLWRGSFSVSDDAQLQNATIWAGGGFTGEALMWPTEASVAPVAPTPSPNAPLRAEGTVSLSDALHAEASSSPATPFETPSPHEGTLVLSDPQHDRAASEAATPFAESDLRTVVLSDLLEGDDTSADEAPPASSGAEESTVPLSDAMQAEGRARPATPFEGVADEPGRPSTTKPAPPLNLPPGPSTGTVTLSGTDLRTAVTPFDPPEVALPQAELSDSFAESPWVRSPQTVEPHPRGDSQINHHLSPWTRSVPSSPDVPLASSLLAARDGLGEPSSPGSSPSAPLALPPRKTGSVPIRRATNMSVTTVKGAARPPSFSLTVVAKGTCDLHEDGRVTLRDECDLPVGDLPLTPPVEEPASISYPSDLAPFKPDADVVLVGSACPPESTPEACLVRFRFGHPGNRFERQAAVFGPRRWELRGMTAPAPFERLPLSWNYAFGGRDHAINPVGAGHDASASGSIELPRIEDPGCLIKSKSDAPQPMGFGPIPMTWPSRWGLLGSYDAAWLHKRWPHQPADFDWHFYQTAPPFQRLEHLRGDEPFALDGVRTHGGTLAGHLPGLRARAFACMTVEAGEGIEEIPMHLDTVVFNTDAMQMDLVWRGLLEVVDWDAMHIATLFVIHEPLDAAPQTMDEVRALLAAQLVPLEVVEQEPEQDGDPANDVALPPVAAPEIDEANATAEQAHLDAQAAEQAQTEEAIEHQIGELQAKVDTARADAGLPSIDIRNPPATDAPDKNAMLAKLKKAGMSEAHMASLFGGSAGAAAPPPATMLANLKDDLGGLMKKAGLPQEKIDETMADFPELPEPPEPPEPPAVPDVKPAAVSEPDLSEREGVIAALERGDDFDGASLAGVDLSDLDFSGRSMKGAMLQGCDLSRSLFDGCDLSEAQLGGANLSSASFKVATLDEADLSGCVAEEACFDEASMAGCEGEAMLAQAARFVGATGKGLRLPAAQLNGACFDKAELPALDLTGATFDGASFEHAQVPKIRLYGATGTGARFSGADLSGARADGVCLPQAIFEKAIANDSVWEGAKLDGVSFLGSQLEKARFVGASLPGAIFSKARLRSACLDNATLTEASFLKTDLMGASFEGADLSHADLRGANLYGVASWRAKTEKINIEQAYVVNTQLGGRK